jgi:lipid-binding SYLF domain-containing protein
MHAATMKRVTRGSIFLAILAPIALGGTRVALADSPAEAANSANKTVALYKKTDPGLATFFEKSAGYAVLSVGKAGFGIGGAAGKGVLYEKDKITGKTTMAQATIGWQIGAQSYSEVIFFENEVALAKFKGGNFAFAAQVSAVALKSGASANAKYRDGVAVFTATKAGLMLEASLGGQKFNYEPYPPKS